MILKLTCDLCEGKLQKHSNGAVCSVCGLLYGQVRLQEKLALLPPEATQPQTPLTNAFDYPGTAQAYFSELLRREFPQYELRENVRHRDLIIPIHYMLCRGVQPIAAIFLIGRTDLTATFQVEKATRMFSASGVTCLHFFSDCRNDVPYVTQRIRSVLPQETVLGNVGSPQPQTIILDVLSTNPRGMMAWGSAQCRIRQGMLEEGTPYKANVNTPDGEMIRMGKLKPSGMATAGTEVTMLMQCPKEILPTLRTLYVSPTDFDSVES